MADLNALFGPQQATSDPLDALLAQRANGQNLLPTAAPNPASGGSTIQVFNPFGQNLDTGIKIGESGTNFLAGAGQALTNIGRGVGERAGLVSPLDIQESRKLDAPLNATTAGKVGNIVGNLAAFAPTAFIPGANTVAGSGLIGATAGVLSPSTSASEMLTNTALGGAGGMAAAWLGNKLAGVGKAHAPSLTEGQQTALQTADQLGLKTTPAQQSGSRALGQVESMLESHPQTSGPFNTIKANNTSRINSIAADAIGVKANELSAPILNRALENISGVYDKVATKTPIALNGDQVMNDLAKIEQNYSGQYAGTNNISDNPLVKNLLNFASNGTATGEQLSSLSSNLGKAAKNNMTSANGDRALGAALFDTKESVDNALQNSLSNELQQEFGQARGNYRNLMNLTARNNIVNPSSGNVNAKALASALMSKDRGGFTFGKNDSDLYNAARFAQAFPSVVNDSGTATRSGTPLTFAGILANLGGAAASRAYMNPLSQALIQAASKSPSAITPILRSPALTQNLPMAGIVSALRANVPQ